MQDFMYLEIKTIIITKIKINEGQKVRSNSARKQKNKKNASIHAL